VWCTAEAEAAEGAAAAGDSETRGVTAKGAASEGDATNDALLRRTVHGAVELLGADKRHCVLHNGVLKDLP
jgi:hypothetical protein